MEVIPSRRRFLEAVKTCGCVDCATSDGLLEFDHVGSKLFDISNAVNRSWPSLVEELARCEVRCRTCHVRRHARAIPHLQRGHGYTADNTLLKPGEGRRCRACHAERERMRYQGLRRAGAKLKLGWRSG